MTAVLPQKDPRLDALLQAGDPRRPTQIYPGFSLTDLWVTQQGTVYVEGAYRYIGKTTDVTLRVSFDSSETGLARRLNGSIAVQQKIADDWLVGIRIEKMSLQGRADDWSSFTTAPISVYGTLQGPGFELRAGEEQGAIQASIAADLGKVMAGLGLAASASVDADGTWRVMATLSGTA
jgi:hypothetical protein